MDRDHMCEGGGCDGMSMKADTLLKRGCCSPEEEDDLLCYHETSFSPVEIN